MSATLADMVAANLSGQAAAKDVLRSIQSGIAHADELHFALRQVDREYGADGTRGFARILQKVLEPS